MSLRTTMQSPWGPLVGAALILAGCGPGLEIDAPPGENAADPMSATQEIWAQVPGAHLTTKELTWDFVTGNKASGSGYGFAAYSVLTPFYGPIMEMSAFYRDAQGCLRRVHMDEITGTWTGEASPIQCTLEPDLTSEPAAVSWGTNRLDVFWFVYGLFGGAAEVHHALWNGSSWIHETLPATQVEPVSAPAVASWGFGHIDLVYRDAAGDLWRREFDRGKKGAAGFTASGWSLTDKKIGNAPTDVALAEPTANRLDLFYRTSLGTLMHKKSVNNGATWTTESLKVTVSGQPSAASWGPNRIDVVAPRIVSGEVQIEHLSQDAGGEWKPNNYPSNSAFGRPVAAAAIGRPNRFDIIGSPGGSSIRHSFYQESLPGFAELNNPQTSYWCFANAAGMVINYMALPAAPRPTCEFVSSQFGQDCCLVPTPQDCKQGGDTADLLEAYSVTWNDQRILTPFELRLELLLRHMPVIAHSESNISDSNHVVVIRDIYNIGGVDYVAIVDPANSGRTWVWPYETFVNYDGNWHVDYMYQGFRRDQ